MGPIELLKRKKAFLQQSKRNKKRDYILENYYDDLKLSDEVKDSIIDSFSKRSLDFEKIFRQYNLSKMYPLTTKLDYDTTIEIANNFFSQIDIAFSNYFKMRIDDKSGITFGENPFTNVANRNLQLTAYRDLRDLYTIVHEFSHLFDSRKGDTATRNVLTETSAQAMERLLDSFLLQLDDSQLEKYGFERNQLKKDILERRISTFVQRMKAVADVRRVMPDFGKKAECSGYMLAEIYSTRFSTFTYQEQKVKIKDLIEAISNDDFECSVHILGVDLSNNNSHRNKTINFVSESIVNDCVEIKKINESQNVKYY